MLLLDCDHVLFGGILPLVVEMRASKALVTLQGHRSGPESGGQSGR
jgi:hypothetical protein